MSSSVYKRIHQITTKETWEESKGEFGDSQDPKNQVKDCKKSGCHDQSWHRRHKQSFFISWILMVRAMHDEMKTLRPLGFCYPVKKVSV